jgi:hypothetical protein
MDDRECVELLHTYHQVAMHKFKTRNQHLIPDIRHWSTHEKVYLVGCQNECVEPNKRVMNSVTKTGEDIKGQRSLEGWAVTKVPLWSKAGLMDHLIKLVVVDDQVRCVKFIYVTSLTRL